MSAALLEYSYGEAISPPFSQLVKLDWKVKSMNCIHDLIGKVEFHLEVTDILHYLNSWIGGLGIT